MDIRTHTRSKIRNTKDFQKKRRVLFTGIRSLALALVFGLAAFLMPELSVNADTAAKTNISLQLSCSPNSSVVNQQVTFTATLSNDQATGNVLFLDGTNELGSAPVSSGTASITTSALNAGTHKIIAKYSGDTNFNGCQNSIMQSTNSTGIGLMLASSQNPSTYGNPISIAVSWTPGDATGNVQILRDGAVVTSAPVSWGMLTVTFSNLSAGNHTIKAVYAGDVSHNPEDVPLTQTVNKADIGLTLKSSDNPSVYGETVTYEARWTPGNATGDVKILKEDGTVVATAPVSNGNLDAEVSDLSAGIHTLRAVYYGDANYNMANDPVTQTITKAYFALSLTSSQNPSNYGNAVTFTASWSPGNATGNVRILVDGISASTAPVSVGTQSLQLSNLMPGTHTIAAIYSGDDNYSKSNISITQTVKKIDFPLYLSIQPTISVYGQPVNFSALWFPDNATGTVQILIDDSVVATAPVSAKNLQTTKSDLTIGDHIIKAVSSGDAYYNPEEVQLTQTVLPNVINLKMTSSQNPSNYGNAVTFTTTWTPGMATGNVQILKDGAIAATAPVSDGTLSLTLSDLTVGSHTIQAVYPGDANYKAADTTLTQTVIKADFALSLTSSKNPSNYGNAVTFTTTWTPGNATGNIQLLRDGSVIATAPVSDGTLSLTLSDLTAGTHTIKAIYSGDANYNPADVPITQTVLSNTIGLKLTSSQNPSTYGNPVTFTASWTPGASTGNVRILVDGITATTAPVSDGTQSLTLSNLTAGTHAIEAVYPGDANYNPADVSLTQTVNKTDFTLSLTSSQNPSTYGDAVTFTAAWTPGKATGNVQLLRDGSVIATAPVSDGTLSLTLSDLTVGSHTIQAVYPGDANYNPADVPLTQIVNKAAVTLALNSSSNPSSFGKTVTFTAVLSNTGATGTIDFYEGKTPLGTASVASGKATYTTESLSTGDHSIRAVYTGDSHFLTASDTILQTVGKATLNLIVSSDNNPSSYGETIAWTASLSSDEARGTTLAPTGTVSFFDGTTLLGTAQYTDGAAVFSYSALSAGDHEITAEYSGDANYNSARFSLSQTVDPVYTVYYVDRRTGQTIAPYQSGSGALGSTVTVNAVPVKGYVVYGAETQTITLNQNSSSILFYYIPLWMFILGGFVIMAMLIGLLLILILTKRR